jgi:Holliday junction resolvase RusA-like endonuclease
MSQSVTLPYPPSVNHLFFTDRHGKRRLSEAGRQFKHDAGCKALAQGMRPRAGAVKVTLVLYRPRKRGDADNPVKVCLDSLTRIAWEDDEQVVELHVYRRDDRERPRVEVTVEEAG